MVRRTLGDALRQLGAELAAEATDADGLRQALKGNVIDLLVADDDLSGLATADIVRDIRRGDLHDHPFPLIVLLANRQDERELRALIDSGSDAIVLTPVSVAAITQKLDVLAARKQFVVARDYVGPNRRAATRSGCGMPLTIEVPNPLRAGADRVAFNRALDKAKADLKCKLAECAYGQLTWAIQTNRISEFADLIPLVERMRQTAANPWAKAAATGLVKALRAESRSDIMGWCEKLLAAQTR